MNAWTRARRVFRLFFNKCLTSVGKQLNRSPKLFYKTLQLFQAQVTWSSFGELKKKQEDCWQDN
jgi:hypothetical protein